MTKCADGKCHKGVIGSRIITAAEWEEEYAFFQSVIEAWNVETRRVAIPHPGFAYSFKFCPVCGHRLAAQEQK